MCIVCSLYRGSTFDFFLDGNGGVHASMLDLRFFFLFSFSSLSSSCFHAFCTRSLHASHVEADAIRGVYLRFEWSCWASLSIPSQMSWETRNHLWRLALCASDRFLVFMAIFIVTSKILSVDTTTQRMLDAWCVFHGEWFELVVTNPTAFVMQSESLHVAPPSVLPMNFATLSAHSSLLLPPSVRKGSHSSARRSVNP